MAAKLDITDDTLQAIVALWNSDKAGLAALFAEPIQAGEIKPGRTLPYARAQVLKGRDAELITAGVWYDYRDVTLELYGAKADASKALALALALFNRRCVLTYPSQDRFFRWVPLSLGELVDTKTKKDGTDVWCATVRAQVVSIRTDN
jgi:hypothetical protein